MTPATAASIVSELETLPEHKPGEPKRERTTGMKLLFPIVKQLLLVFVLFHISLPLWLVYFVTSRFYGRAPQVARASQVLHYAVRTWQVNPPAPGLTFLQRVWLTVLVFRKFTLIPVWGVAWHIDDVLYGRVLDQTPVVKPLIEISAARSGSTQLARYLEDDPALVSPNLLQSILPYLWMWKLAPHTVGRFITREQVQHKVDELLPPEFIERHEGDPFRMDTFEVALFTGHLNSLGLFLGPEDGVLEFGAGRAHAGNLKLWEEDFIRLVDRLARKTIHYGGPGPDGAPRRFFVKGHFLAAAPALARHFPDARFLTMLRTPDKRLQSAINYLRANPFDEVMGSIPWSWLVETIVSTEIIYSEHEQEWFTAQNGAIRCVVRFDEYVKDLSGTMTRIYRELLDGPVPPHVPQEHPPRRRHSYLLDRSLEELHVNEAALRTRLAGYFAWCKGAKS
ncbi:MAG: sulfotransferase [Myxococcota bacterium]